MDYEDLVDFAIKVNDLAHAKGWWVELPARGQDLLREKRLMVVSELGEAIAHLRMPGFTPPPYEKPWEPGEPKPESYMIELADILIRLLDLQVQVMRMVGMDLLIAGKDLAGLLRAVSVCEPGQPDSLALDDVMAMLYRVRSGSEAPPIVIFGAGVTTAISRILAMCEGRNLLEVAKGKHAYNLTREYRHGGKSL